MVFVTEVDWWWTGGVMDGDGCVVVRMDGTVIVAIKQAVKGLALLREMSSLHGGTVYTAGKAIGRRQVAYQWELTGATAKRFCAHVAPYCRLKRSQFELAASVPANPKGDAAIRDEQHRLRNRIRELKTLPHPSIDDVPHRAYAAGFVDTDGSLDILPTTRILVIQKYPAIVDWFAATFGGINYAYKNRQAHEWRVTGAKALALLTTLVPYMRGKRDQATLVLSAKSYATPHIAAHHLRQLKGNQNKKANVHLVTAVNLENANGTLGTGSCGSQNGSE